METLFEKRLQQTQNNMKQRKITKTMYRSEWERFAVWTEVEGLASLPPDACTVGDYLRYMKEQGLAQSSLNGVVAAIAWQTKCIAKTPEACRPKILHGFAMHDARDLIDEIREVYDSIVGEMEQKEPNRARAITPEDLSAIILNGGRQRQHHVLTGIRQESREHARKRAKTDKALFLVMYDGLLRGSEAGAVKWSDITRQPDGSGDLHVRKSKTSAKRRTRNRYLRKETMEALGAIRPAEYDPEAYVFAWKHPDGSLRPITRKSISIRLKKAAKQAGIEGWERFSSHSFRVGGAQFLSSQGASDLQIADAGDWGSTIMVLQYVRAGDREQSAIKRFMPESIVEKPL